MTIYEAFGWLTARDWWMLSFVAGFMFCVGALFVGGLMWVRLLLRDLDQMAPAPIRSRRAGRTSRRG